MKLFLAGLDTSAGTEIRYLANCSNYLTTFYQHQNKFNKDWIDSYKKTTQAGAEWIMDSGLFTMMFGAGSDITYNEKDLIEYTYKYLNAMKKINFKGTIVEMDVHKVLGIDKLAKFRKIFEKEYDIEKTIFVWHIEEGKDGFDKLCNRYPYIAISIPELRKVLKGKNKLEQTVKHLIGRANQINPNIKIHLLGCTQQNLMEQGGYYSCDSTSWLSGGRYGMNAVWFKNKIKTIPIRSKMFVEYKNTYEKEWQQIQKFTNSALYYKDFWLSAKSYIKLNEHINNKYFKGEAVKKLW